MAPAWPATGTLFLRAGSATDGASKWDFQYGY